MVIRSPWLVAVLIAWCFLVEGHVGFTVEDFPSFGPLVTKESRRTLVSTESGMITAVDVQDGRRGPYHLQFITLEPSSLFLPVLLHTDMVFFVHTGRGTVSWVSEDGKDGKDGINHLAVERGDIYRLEEGSVFYVQSHADPTREKLRIHAIFDTVNIDNPTEASVGAYSNVSDLVRGFDDQVLQMGFRVSQEVVQAIKWVERPPSIVHFAPNTTEKPDWNEVLEVLIGGRNPIGLFNGKKKKTKTKTFNVFRETPDVENCNGWSIAVTSRGLRALKGSDIGVFMVNLTKGSMMSPHWNPKATEIAVVVHGRGMVQVVCPSNPSVDQSAGPFKCENMKFRVKEGDVFIVPRFHPMAQMSFNDDSLVFMGFSTTARNNHPQFLAGKWSVLRAIDKEILALSFGASNTTIEKLLATQDESVMLECTSCAEEVEKKMEEEIERKRQEEEARKREEEEAKRREEEEEARRRQEEARKREEEEAREREEEARKREEEEAREREEETRKREEEEARKREEEARKREEEEAREREEEAKRREEEEAIKREEEQARKREEEEAIEREEEEARRREEEEARKRTEEEARRREEEEARKREEQAKREEEEGRRREEEEARKEAESAKARKWEEEVSRREEEEKARKGEEEAKREEEEEREGKEKEREVQEEQEVARREEEERQRQIKEEEARKQGQEQQKEVKTPDGRREGENEIMRGKVMWKKMWRV